MRTSLAIRAVCPFAAVTLFLTPGLEVALGHGGPSFGSPAMRSGFVHGHGQGPAWSGGRSSWNWRGQSRGNRWSRNGWLWNRGGFYGSGFWYSPYAFADTGGGGAGPVITVTFPSFNDFPPAPPEGADPASRGGCVIHKLSYDSAGNFVGERQTSRC